MPTNYFNNYDTFFHQYKDDDGNLKEIELKDINLRFKIRDLILSNSAAFYDYRWSDEDRPETLAFNYYGDESFYWVVFFSNNFFDYADKFPKPQRVFNKFLEIKYADKKSDADAASLGIPDFLRTVVKEYRDEDGFVIDKATADTDPNSKEVSIFEFEEEKNEEFRTIKLLDRGQLQQFVREYERRVANATE